MKTGIYWQDPKYAVGRDFILDPSLVLYLPLYKLDGASIMSRDAYGHLYTVTGALWRPDGRLFDGSDDFISVPHHASLIFGTGDFSIWMWIKTQDTAESYNRLVDKNDVDLSTGGYVFYIRKSDGALRFGIDNTYVSPVSPADVQDDTWHFVGVTADRDDVATFYVDGAPDGTADISGESAFDIDSTTNLRIGADQMTTPTLKLKGLVGELAIHNRLLSAGEIAHNCNVTKWRYR